jgi:hypothetical protein
MASIISAGTTDSTSLNVSGDKTGILQLASNNAVTAVTIDASQNVGIGTTSPENKLTLLKNTTAATENSYGISIQSVNTNAYTELLLGASDAVDAGIIQTAAKNTNFTAKNLALQPQGGNVGIGTSSPGSLFDVYKDSGTAYSSSNTIAMGQWARISNPNTVSGAGVSLMFRAAASSLATIACVSTATAYSSALTFATRNSAGDISESMRIDSSGNVGIGASPQFKLDVQSTLDGPVVRVYNGRDTAGSIGIKVTLGVSGGAGTTGSAHFHGNTNAVGNWYLYGNGTTSYSSDQRLKKNIETTRDGYLEDLARLRVVKFNWNVAAEGAPKELGLIAQEVEQVFPGLVQDDANPVTEGDDTVYKQLKQSVLPFMLLKAIQELKAINDTQAETINALTARIVALEQA